KSEGAIPETAKSGTLRGEPTTRSRVLRRRGSPCHEEETIMRPIRNRTNRAEKNRNAIAGIQKHLSTNPTVILDGVAYAPAEVIATLQKAVDTADAIAASKAAFHKAV